MKSNRQNINASDITDIDPLISQIKKEKEALVSMFLANATITELAAQYKLIDELNEKIKNVNKSRP
ncbi:MAG: hypothetical protein H0W12_10940 [Chitinophagaceae bacterium]|nr:hypothetical protein [Chitinophagaceae bacterium]